jgi:hypothetical protein
MAGFGSTFDFTIFNGGLNARAITFKGNTNNALIGTDSDTGERLQVTGDVKIVGSGNTSGTTALTVQNSSLNNLFAINNAGTATFLNLIRANGITANASSNLTFQAGSSAAKIILQTFANAASNVNINLGSSFTNTAGNVTTLLLDQGFAPTSGTAVLSLQTIAPTINQTGGANGITRGLYVNPTLTAAADFRAIETTNGKVIFGNLPTSSAGLPTGAIWNDAGTIKIV